MLSVVLAFLFLFSAGMKLAASEQAISQAGSMGIDAATFRWIGLLAAVSIILFLVPGTAYWGALPLVAYMGGAIATHLQQHQPVGMAITVQVILWVTIALRFPEWRQRLLSARQELS